MGTTGFDRIRKVNEMKHIRFAIMDAGYITLMPGDYVPFADGDHLDYNQARYLLAILENEDEDQPYATDEENRQYRIANAERFAPQYQDIPRGRPGL